MTEDDEIMKAPKSRLVLLCLAVIALVNLGACHKTKVPASSDGADVESGSPPSEDAGGFRVGVDWDTCGGSVTLAGDTPRGALPLTEIFVYLPYCPRRFILTLRQKWMKPAVPNGPRGTFVYDGPTLELVIPILGGASAALLGQFQATATLTIPGQSPLTSSAAVEVSRTDDPFPDGGSPQGQEIVKPPGSIAGTFKLVEDGFSLSGSFDSPYCASHDECSTL